ncbi:unnamed protein product [Coregonus sp. 'balchen']|nr:unnamed protein product [Coregonus sp. 'balchen']
MHNEDGDLWEKLSHYNTDGRGVVNLTRDESVGGSYVGCEPMGLFWALQPAPGERERVENLCCPLLYIVGEDDLSCAAIEKADEIEKKLKDVGRSHLFTRLSYPGAGHLIEPPYTPNAHASMWTKQPQKLITLWGGHLVPHAATQEDAWKRTLEFMERHLRGKEYK